MTRRRTFRLVALMPGLALVVSGLLAACASAAPIRLYVSGTLAAVPELAVSGRQDWSRLTGKPVLFGEYRAEEVRKGWRSETRRSSGAGMGLAIGTKHLSANEETVKARQKLQFRLVAPGVPAATVYCLRAEQGESLVFRRQTENSEGAMRVREDLELSLACTAEGDDGNSWSLALDSRDPRFFSGTLTTGEREWRVEPSREVASPKAPGGVTRIPAAAGYLFELEGQARGAVELMGTYGVRIDPNLPAGDRAALAGAMVALLLIGD